MSYTANELLILNSSIDHTKSNISHLSLLNNSTFLSFNNNDINHSNLKLYNSENNNNSEIPAHLNYHYDNEVDIENTVSNILDELDMNENENDLPDVDPDIINNLLKSFQLSNEGFNNDVLPEDIVATEKVTLPLDPKSSQPLRFPKVRWPFPKKRFTMMTPYDMDFVLRSSLFTLRSTTPWRDEFYYQITTARKGGAYKGVGFPVASGTNGSGGRNKDGTVVLPTGTLGRLRANSIRKPRTLLDFSAADNDNSPIDTSALPPKRTAMMSHLAISYVIEEGLRAAADCEDFESLILSMGPMPMPSTEENADNTVYEKAMEQRNTLQSQFMALQLKLLVNCLDLVPSEEGTALVVENLEESHLIYSFIKIPKGRLLLYRSLAILAPRHAFNLAYNLIKIGSKFFTPERYASCDAKFGPVLKKVILQLSLEHCNHLFGACLNPYFNKTNTVDIITFVQSRIGRDVLYACINKGEEIIFQRRMALVESAMKWVQMRDFLVSLISHRWLELVLIPTAFLPYSTFESSFPALQPQQVDTKYSHLPPIWTALADKVVDKINNIANENKEKLSTISSVVDIMELIAAILARVPPHFIPGIRSEIGELIHGSVAMHPSAGFIGSVLFAPPPAMAPMIPEKYLQPPPASN